MAHQSRHQPSPPDPTPRPRPTAGSGRAYLTLLGLSHIARPVLGRRHALLVAGLGVRALGLAGAAGAAAAQDVGLVNCFGVVFFCCVFST